MGVKEDILIRLCEGETGGEALARELNVTRAAVWKAVRALCADGYDIISDRRGYKLAYADVPCAEVVEKKLKTAWKVESLVSVPSTMERARRLAESGADRVAVIAEEQTAGRGRLDRRFYSPRGAGLYISAVLRPDIMASDCGKITAYAAVAAARATERLCGAPVSIKWVNDLYMNGKKICGVLTEGGFGMESGKLSYAVVGIGINTGKGEMPASVTERASDVFTESGVRVSRSDLAAALLDELADLPCAASTGDFIDEYRRRSCVIGRRVTVNGEYDALAVGIADDCSLILEKADGERVSFAAGEVSLKL